MAYAFPTFVENTIATYYGGNKPRKCKITITRTESSSKSSTLTVLNEDGSQLVTISAQALAIVAKLNTTST